MQYGASPATIGALCPDCADWDLGLAKCLKHVNPEGSGQFAHFSALARALRYRLRLLMLRFSPTVQRAQQFRLQRGAHIGRGSGKNPSLVLKFGLDMEARCGRSAAPYTRNVRAFLRYAGESGCAKAGPRRFAKRSTLTIPIEANQTLRQSSPIEGGRRWRNYRSDLLSGWRNL